jgi:pimeloyl-ACP methyl ester carboxylesterase
MGKTPSKLQGVCCHGSVAPASSSAARRKSLLTVYSCLGRHDYEVPSVLSAKYFEALKAPRQQLVWFESSSHMPNTEERDKFNEFMITTVFPALPG